MGSDRGDDRQSGTQAQVELKLDAARWRKKRGMIRLLDALGAEEGLTRYVGGAVRDDLLGLPISDIDLATKLQPRDVVARLEKARIKAVPTGLEHGTITAVSDGQPVEVTTLRRDLTTDGRRATVAFTDDWKEDAARRDFTINALFADPSTGELFDYFGGLADLEAKHVRFIGNPLQRIGEDHLRILRFFRFHARFDRGRPDQAALEACTQRANDLMALSRERIADELLKLLAIADPSRTVAIMLERSILKAVLPEITLAQLPKFQAMIEAEKVAMLDADPVRRLLALLPEVPDLAQDVAVRLRLSNKARKRMACAGIRTIEGSPEALAYWLGNQCAVDRLLLGGRPGDAARIADWPAPRLPISGGTLIALGLAQGPVVAHTLQKIERAWVEADFPVDGQLEEIVTTALKSAPV